MFDARTSELINTAINAEYDNAKRYGEIFHGMHEGWGVAKEEVWETGKEYKAMKYNCKEIFKLVAANADARISITNMMINARNLAMEACQVAAVCQKMLASIEAKK